MKLVKRKILEENILSTLKAPLIIIDWSSNTDLVEDIFEGPSEWMLSEDELDIDAQRWEDNNPDDDFENYVSIAQILINIGNNFKRIFNYVRKYYRKKEDEYISNFSRHIERNCVYMVELDREFNQYKWKSM